MSKFKISKARLAEIIREEYELIISEDIMEENEEQLDEDYMDKYDRAYEEEERERRRQMRRIEAERERNRKRWLSTPWSRIWYGRHWWWRNSQKKIRWL